MKRYAIGAFALSAALAGVSASANTLISFNETFESDTVDQPPSASGWTVPTDAAFVSSAQVPAGSTKSLAIDTDAANEVKFTPAANQVEKVSLDVYLTAGTSAPTPFPSDAKLVVYLKGTDLMGSVDGTEWKTIASGVQPNVWTNITISFSSESATVETKDGDSYTFSSHSIPAKVSSVGFTGTGYIDNFVGTYEYNYAYDDTDTSTSGESAAEATIVVENGTVTASYPNVSNMKFVRVYDDHGNYVTLRTTSTTGLSIDTSKLPGTVTKVVAYHGDSVSNVDSNTSVTPTSAEVTKEGSTFKVGVTVRAKSGVVYSLYDPDNDTYIAEHVATPVEEKTEITLKAPVSDAAWGKVKFQVKASDVTHTVGN